MSSNPLSRRRLLALGLGSACALPATAASVKAITRSPHCPAATADEAEAHKKALTAAKDRILAASKLITTDKEGFRHWRTPYGDFWIPKGSDYVLPFNLAEQELNIYGTGDMAVRQGDVVLDCGANVGVYARKALHDGARTVVAIEIAPENLTCLRRNFAKEIAAGSLVVYPKGVWDKDDMLTLKVSPDNSAADTVVLQQKGAVDSIKVPLTTIDKLVPELKLDKVDYIKMDIEGAETNALRGGQATMARFHPRLSLSAYHLPTDPVRIPPLVKKAWAGYRMTCGPCAVANNKIRPDILYFR